jgi:hypothetical protein
MKKIILSLTLGVLSLLGFTQQNCPCCSAPYQEFDFWLGEWEVFDTSYNWVGRNSLVKREFGCVIQESWTSQGSGTSLNYFDRNDSLWHQLWVASAGSNLKIYGGIKDGKMVMQSDLIPGRRIPFYRNRITWTPNSDGTVTQRWDIVDSSNTVLQTSFLGIYHPRIEIKIEKPLGGYILVRNDSIFDYNLDLEKQATNPKAVSLDWSKQLSLKEVNEIKGLAAKNFEKPLGTKSDALAFNYSLSMHDKKGERKILLAYENQKFKLLLEYLNALKSE